MFNTQFVLMDQIQLSRINSDWPSSSVTRYLKTLTHRPINHPLKLS